MANETHKPDEVARHYLNIGVFYRGIGDFPKALESFQKSLKVMKEFGVVHDRYEAALLSNIGEVYGESGEYSAALDSLNKALILVRKQRDRSIEADCLQNIGNIYAKTMQLDRALSQYHQALKINQEIHARHSEGNCWNSLGEAFYKMKNYSEATLAHQRALAIAQELNMEKIAWEAYSGLAMVSESIGKYLEALRHYKLAITKIDSARGELYVEEFKSDFQKSKLEIYEHVIKLLARLHDQNPQAEYALQAFTYAERAKARTLLDLVYQGQVFQNLNAIDEDFRLQFLVNATSLEQKHEALAKELARPDTTRDVTKINLLETEIANLQKERAEIFQAIEQKYPQYHKLTQPEIFTIEEIQNKILRPNQVLVEYFVGKEQTFVWIIRRDRAYFEIINKGRDWLRQKLAGISANLFTKATTENVVADGETMVRNHAWANIQSDSLLALYRALWQQPVEKYLRPDEALIIVPDDALFYFPFEMLVTEITPSRSHYLIERYPISYAASASLLNPNLHQPGLPQKGAIAIANPDFNGSQKIGVSDYLRTMFPTIFRADKLLSLPFSEMEAKAIVKEIPQSEIYIGKKATEENYKAAAGQFRFIHLATHNILNDQRPMFSRLIFTPGAGNEDGFYNMYEIFNLRLNADLVVLSACNTGLGKFSRGEGLIGMSRAFMYAGVPSVMASLWWVEDAATAYLMQQFYKYLKAGLPKSVALQKAKIDIMNAAGKAMHRAARNPFYWAPFILMGESGPVKVK